MKKSLSLLLVLAMLVTLLPAFSIGTTAAEEAKDISGLNATLYQLECKPDIYNFGQQGVYEGIIQGTNGRGGDCSYNDSKHFDASIDTMLYVSKENPNYAATGLGNFEPIGQDGYFLKWTGTITAANDGTYYLVGRKIDNGFVMFVDKNGDGTIDRTTEKVYEYWAENHWFDGGNDRLVTDLGGFTLTAGTATAVEIWYLEMDGGDVVSINASLNADGADDKSFGDQGLTLNLARTCYVPKVVSNHDRIYAVLPNGVKGGACVASDHNHNDSGNCSSAADAGNHLYDTTIDAIKAEMLNLGTIKLPNFEKNAFQGLSKYGFRYEDSLIEYTGYMTPTVSGAYQFGTSAVDNCLMLEINIDGTWTRVYEFWAGRVWNDASTTYSDAAPVTLEKDKAYEIRATYLEIDGGEGLSTLVKVDGTQYGLTEVVAFTTEKPTAPVRPATVKLFDNSTATWYYTLSGENNDLQIRDNAWIGDPSVHGEWATTTMPITDGSGLWTTNDNGTKNQSLWAVTAFNIDDVTEYEGYELMANVNWDDNIRLYVNGKLVNVELGWGSGTWSLGEEATELLVSGTNVIAMKLVQGWGGASINFSELYLSLDDNTNNPYEFKYIDKDGVKQNGRITTEEQLIAYIADANARGKGSNKDDRISIEADLDFTGYAWTPLNSYVGRIFGNGHTISNITYTVTKDAAVDAAPVGLFVNDLSNGGGNGLIYDLNFDHCVFTVNAINGGNRDNSVIAGLVAGLCDRGCIENVTVQNSEIAGTAGYAAGIAGVASWNYDQKGVHVENCGLINSTITATIKASGILGFAKYGDRVLLGNAYVENVTLDAPASSATVGEQWDNGNLGVLSTTLVGDNYFGQTLTPTSDYDFYFQTRDNADGTSKDIRVICVAKKAWFDAAASCNVKITLTDGTTPVFATVAPDKVYYSINAASGAVTDVYTAAADAVIFGWVITGVPAGYASTSGDNIPTAVVQ